MKIEAVACDLCGATLKDNEEPQKFTIGIYSTNDVCLKCANKIEALAQGLSPDARAERAAKRKAAAGKKK
ncbi:MAG: hypothetical protein A4E61_00483 [Syntrophorhabdus sp. PtaB.Bin184]|nr:MAG: hypothetical protein A4E61_00483 [Syntrophorhabdus sp. PtaB.Bin184]